MLPALLASIGLPVLVRTLGSALDKIDNPVAKGASEALKHVDDALNQGSINPEEIKEINRHIENMAQLDSAEFKTLIEQVNSSLRTESASSDPYVRRMRPTFGYIMAITWAAQMLAIAAVILEDPEKAGTIIQAMDSLSMIWTVGLSVLGVYVYKRSQEKGLAPGGQNLAKIASNLVKAKKI
ncbi:MAG TPA: 3TM-type holin [Alphaproteobacteria bacterium]